MACLASRVAHSVSWPRVAYRHAGAPRTQRSARRLPVEQRDILLSSRRTRLALWEDWAPDHLIVPFQLIPLAVLSAITSPTAMAVVLLILRRPHPVRLLSAYVIGSFVMSVLAGIAVVAGLSATSVGARRNSAAISIFDITIGVLILVTAAWWHSERSAAMRQRTAERLARRKAQNNARSGDKPSWSSRILSSGSVGRLAALGMVMHLPGLLYLAALGYIAHRDVSTSNGLLLIVLFNIVMLAPIELPLLGYVAAPQRTEETVRSVNAFINEHRGKGLLLVSVVAGGYLVVSGIVGLVA